MLRKNKTIKAIISLVLVTMLMFSCFSITASASVRITDISYKPITLIEYYDGFYIEEYNPETEDYDLEYYYYDIQEYLECRVTFSDGTDTLEFGLGDVSTDQSYDNQWKAGNTYTVDVTLWGYDTEVEVTIVDSPIERIEVEPISIIEGTEGYHVLDYNSETDDNDLEYYSYYPERIMEYTVIFKNGDTVNGQVMVLIIRTSGIIWRLKLINLITTSGQQAIHIRLQ